jgi:hypothetical protein
LFASVKHGGLQGQNELISNRFPCCLGKLLPRVVLLEYELLLTRWNDRSDRLHDVLLVVRIRHN